jgi:4-hydroxybenzoate polyprenyltransferase
MSASNGVPTPVSARERIVALWTITHPGPSLVTALAYASFALLAAHGRPDPTRLVVTVIGLVGQQFAISAFNDYRDREADVHSHKYKPIARGVLPPWVALIVAALSAALMAACFAPYGLAPLLIAGAFLALGVAYDLGVKSTPFGGVMMGLAFPLLPLLAWELFATVKPALYWTFPLGLALGLAIHLADALPDAAADSVAGARGLAQMLERHALTTCWLFLLAANALVVTLAATGIAPARPAVLAVAIPLALVTLLAAVLVARRGAWSERRRLRANFILTITIALLTALGWLIAAVL